MNVTLKKTASNIQEQSVALGEELKKIDQVRLTIGPVPEKFSKFCGDASIARYLRARNWHVKKATKMLKDSLKWRLEFKPEKIRWEDIASEAESGKVYRSTSVDKKGRPVLVMRPCHENSKSVAGQIKYLVYCMENAILNLPPNQEQMVWLVDFWNFNITNVSLKSAKETAHVLQNHYPERLGVAIMYNPPRIFEQFYKDTQIHNRIGYPYPSPSFIGTRTRKKVKFVYTDDISTKKIMEELFEMDQLESAFGGNSSESFDIQKYAQRMKEDDEKMHAFWEEGNGAAVISSSNVVCHESSPSNNEDSFEEEEEQNGTPSSSTAEGSLAAMPDVGLSVSAMSLEDPQRVKA